MQTQVEQRIERRFWKVEPGMSTLTVPRVPSEFTEAKAANLFFECEEFNTTHMRILLSDTRPPHCTRNLVHRVVPSINIPDTMRTFPDFFYSALDLNGGKEGSKQQTMLPCRSVE